MLDTRWRNTRQTGGASRQCLPATGWKRRCAPLSDGLRTRSEREWRPWRPFPALSAYTRFLLTAGASVGGVTNRYREREGKLLGQVREAETAFNVREASSRREMERLAEFNAHLLKLLQGGSPAQASAAAGMQGTGMPGMYGGPAASGTQASAPAGPGTWLGAYPPQQQPVQPPQPPPAPLGATQATAAPAFAHPEAVPTHAQNATLEVG